MKDKISKLIPIRKASKKLVKDQPETSDVATVPRITNETVAEHREEVLKGARKYIYPLQHSKHRIVLITSGIALVALLGFLTYCVIGLYKFHDDNTFLYRVTQVVPFPVARSGGNFIAYENYLFELRHYEHYYQVQLQRDFKNPEDRQQLIQFRKQALAQVINDGYIKQLAHNNGVTVSDKEIKDRIKLVKDQNRLGNNNRVFEDVLKDYWGWSTRDFERSLRQEILSEKVVAKLDSGTSSRAAEALQKLQGGTNFNDLAKQISDDPGAKSNGGDYGFAIDKNSRDVSPEIVRVLSNLKPGQVSGIINTGSSLEIVKLNQRTGDKVTAWHIVFNFRDINQFLSDIKQKQKASTYISV